MLLVEKSTENANRVIGHLRAEVGELAFERVENAAQLRAALGKQVWDVVLGDYPTRGFDAQQALAIIKEAGLDLPFIIVSSTMREEAAVEAMYAGAHDFFVKGNLARLLPAIQRERRDLAGRAEHKRLQEERLLLDRLVSIGTLAAGVAHEINNPLAYVIANIDFALDRLVASDQATEVIDDLAEVTQALQQAREGSERIRITARDLKVFCHTDHGGPTSVDVRRVLESAMTMAWNEIRHRARLVKVFANVPRVDANENRLAQVFLNLLINAAQAIPEGNAPGNEIKVATWSDGGQVIVEISDTGGGIAPDTMPRLFQPFFTTKEAGIGTGLGLAICQGIVTDLGGSISVRSQLGSGATFRVAFPEGTRQDSLRPSVMPSHSPGGRRGRVLVVDDEPALVRTIERLLKSEHEVRASSDVKGALQMLISEQNFDVILCDLMMPEMTGMDFHAQLALAAPQMAERVVFLTAGAFTAKAKQYIDRVPNRRLEKPFEASALRATIHKLIARVDTKSANGP
ncbi:MAG TPA: response regulator [Polyangiaceae bacterium]|nr:response regulator [Polyangiaceae bacterium]